MSLPLSTASEPDPAIDVFVARQPIFRRDLQVHGYELLYRSSPKNAFDGTSAEIATARVMVNAFLAIGGDKLLNHKPAFLNLDGAMLTLPYASLLPFRSVVIEILEHVIPTPEVLEACRGLKRRGYTLALDDCSDVSAIGPWQGVVDLIKVDFQQCAAHVREELIQTCRRKGLKALAEKVETPEEYRLAASLGYDYYQGYFFARPEMVTGRAISESKMRLLRMLREVSRDDVDLDQLERLVLEEVALTYKLLRYLNSAAFGFRSQIKSVRHALALLGEQELRKWICLLLLATLGQGKPSQIIIDSLLRARFGELLAPHLGLGGRKSTVFLLGLLSHLDAILGCDMGQALDGLALEADVRNTLLEHNQQENALTYLYLLIKAYNAGDWIRSVAVAEKYRLPLSQLSYTYTTAVHWADAVAATAA